jgi:hypothetical protein
MSVGTSIPPPPVSTPEEGGGSEWVELHRASNDIDAHLLTGRLEEAGIETRWVKDRGSPGAWLYGGSNPWAPVTIFVRRYQLVDARIVLADISLSNSSAPDDDPNSSPWTIPLVWWVTAILLGVAFTAVWLLGARGSIRSCEVPVVCDHSP